MTTKFGDTIKKLRIQNNLTQSQLAQVLSVGRPTIAGYETKGKQPDYDKLEKLANYFDVTIDYLLGNAKEPYTTTSALVNGATLENNASYNGKIVNIDLELKALVNKLDLDYPNILFDQAPLNRGTIIALKNSLTTVLDMVTAMNQLNEANEKIVKKVLS
ncbi:MAG: hypothetical protein CVU84_16700 [Firmicutes bacterium HGW-Firmicutes-1]|jgi:transcriptional regulator with XRE-family HTH domain|nr:MAG: hypothetical protein CVU84_16700 [Firmicutes bacterium HGW-Firmicutes-1]